MGALQVVFASNPQKVLQSQDKSGSIKSKRGSRMKPSPKQLRARKKFAAMARARGKASRAAKKAKIKKNPYKFVGSKGKRKISTGAFASKKELKGLTKKSYHFDQALGRGYLRKRSAKGRAVSRATKSVKRVLKAAPSARRKAVSRAAALRRKGYKIKKVYISPKSVLASAASAGKRKRRKKRSGGNRKTSRKESKVAKRRRKKKSKGGRKARRKHARARKSPRRRRSHRRSRKGGRVIVLRRKGQSVRIKRNPIRRYAGGASLSAKLEKYTGLHAEEVGSLLLGGALYGTVDGLLQKYIPQAYTMAAQIPVIGTTAIPLLAAIGVKLLNKGKIKPLDMLAEGLIGAALVAMGVQASHLLLPAPAAPVAGVDYTPGRGVMMGGYARDGADFGNVDFTPGPGVMMGQPQLGMQAQMGTSNASRNGADFGLIPSGLGDMGVVPEGMGGLG